MSDAYTPLVVRCELSEKPTVKHIRVRASIFFDGTQNNRSNTRDRLDWQADGSVGDAPGDGSFENDYSNVAKLYDCYNKAQPGYDITVPPLYVEGIGTTNHESDSILRGVALGMGATGVPAKVDRGLGEIIQAIRDAVGNPTPTIIIDCLHLDSFGFSRGAAAARHYVHKAMRVGATVAKQMAQAGYSVGEIKLRFVGLFDTVASYGVVHKNDTRDLNLDAITVAETVFQIAAAEEYRENFRLTNIKSKGATEVFMPGAHSDIGGSYIDDDKEEDHHLFEQVDIGGDDGGEMADLILKARDRDYSWFLERGWYKKSELTKIGYSALVANRKHISNRYARIPLHMMADRAGGSTLKFTTVLDDLYRVPTALGAVQATIEDAVNKGRAKSADIWLDEKADLVGGDFRNRYLHFSARYNGFGNAPEWSGQSRKRIVQDG